MRTLFNQPLRKGITDEFYPDKMTMEQFKAYIVDHFDAYQQNIANLKADGPKFIEEWVEQYLAWLDIEQES